ncbi:hypothetical protein DTO271G3_3893 [Paecilomyces variotii]|nr:hypothetical protein DTO271G3_3893 [Paecilomyces variotii]
MARNSSRLLNPEHQGSYSQSYLSRSPVAEAAIARDLAEYTDDRDLTATDDESEASTVRPVHSLPGTAPHSLAGSYQRPSFFTAGPRGIVIPHQVERDKLTKREREQALEEERDLLSDSNVISSEHQKDRKDREHRQGKLAESLSRTASYSTDNSSRIASHVAEETATGGGAAGSAYNGSIPTETTSLLDVASRLTGDGGDPEDIDRKWEEAVAAGLIRTTWKREARVIGQYSAPLMLTFLLQYSLTVASIFTLGHLGKVELGAVSLASMTASITGYGVYQGLATSLDTLCAQAYGSGRKKLVGLQMQRMIYFLWLVTIPIALIWFFADRILMKIVPEKDVAVLAGRYLKIVVLGAPGYACFESGKRYVQAQGLFSASLYILLICAPLNAFMNWLFVWKLNWGFIGAPVAVAITDNLLPFCLFLYVYFIAGHECWNGFTRRALHNWGPMIRLALPGLLMVEAEVLAFEILTLASSYLGTTPLAAQSVLSTISSITFQIPFPLSIAGSTRIANLIGATLADAARTSAKVTITGAVIVGLFNMIILSVLRFHIAALFTSDEEVIEIIAQILPLCAAFQLFDALAANCNGILRGLGRQEIGGYVQLFCYYAIAMPISMGTTFGLGWGLWGLWTGVAIALGLVSLTEGIFLIRIDWQRSVDEATQRKALG